MTLAKAGRPTRAETAHKRSVARQLAEGMVARRKKVPDYLETAESLSQGVSLQVSPAVSNLLMVAGLPAS